MVPLFRGLTYTSTGLALPAWRQCNCIVGMNLIEVVDLAGYTLTVKPICTRSRV